MADFDIEQFKEQEAAAAKIEEITEKIKQNTISTSEALEEQLDNNNKLIDALKNQLGAQADLLREKELEQQLISTTLERAKEELKLSQELAKLQKIQGDNKLGNLTETQKQRLAELETIKDNLSLGEDALKNLKEKIEKLDEQNEALEKINATQKNVDKLLENEFKQRTGLVTSSQSLAQEMARVAVESGNSMEFLNNAAKNMSAQLTKANLLNSAMAKMGELGDEFNKTMIDTNGLLMEFAQADIQFVRDTGLVKELGTEVKNLRFEFNDLNFLAAETDQAFRGLTQSFTDFTEVDASVRRDLTEGAAVLERFGVSSDVTGGSIDRFTKALGKTPNAALKSTKEMVKFARALGVGPNKLMGELNQNFEIFAEFGTKKGVDIFKKLQTAAKQTGIEFNKLTGIINKFDQSIEGTMEATGDLNFLLGGPFINSMELLEAEGPEKFEILRSAIEESGQSFDDMGRRQKKAIADLLGTDIEAASRFFSGQAGDINAATAAIEGQAGEMKDLGKEAADNILLKEKEQLAQEAQVAAMQNFADAILKANQMVLDLKKTFAPFVTILGGIASIASTLFNAFVMYKVLFAGSDGPLSGLGTAFTGLKDKLMGFGGAVKNTFKNAMGTIGKTFTSIRTAGDVAFEAVKKKLGGTFTSIQVSGKNAFDAVKKKLGSLGKAFTSIRTAGATAFDAVKEKLGSLGSVFTNIGTAGTTAFDTVKSKLMNFGTAAGDIGKNIMTGLKEKFQNFSITDFTENLKSQLGGAFDLLKSKGADMIGNLKTGFDILKTNGQAAFQLLKDKGMDLAANVSQGFLNMKDGISNFVGSAVEGAMTTASSWVTSARTTAAGWFQTAAATMGSWALMAKDAVVKAATTAAGWVSSAAATFTAWVTTTAPAFIAAATAMIIAAAPILLPILAIGAAIAGIVIFWDELVGAFSAGFEFLKEAFSGYLDFIKDGFKMFLHGMVVLAEVIAHAITLPFTAVIEGAAAIIDLIPGMGGVADAARSFSPGRIIRSYATEIHASIDAFEKGTDATKGGAFIAGDSSTGAAKPEMVVAPPMSSVINNKNLQTLASLIQNNNTPPATAGGEANLNVTLKLDEKVLATHTEKVSRKTSMELFGQSR